MLDISGWVASNPTDKAVITRAEIGGLLRHARRSAQIEAQKKPMGTT